VAKRRHEDEVPYIAFRSARARLNRLQPVRIFEATDDRPQRYRSQIANGAKVPPPKRGRD
jgi:hypothetical protein